MKRFLLICSFALVILFFGCTKDAPTPKSIVDAMPKSVETYSIAEYKAFLCSKGELVRMAFQAFGSDDSSFKDSIIRFLNTLDEYESDGIYFNGAVITPEPSVILPGDNIGKLISSTKISYTTKGVGGRNIKVSGRVTFPFFASKARNIILSPMITAMQESIAPSTCGFSIPSDLLAMLGYVVVTPDYIGYGDSKNLNHPFAHNELTATTCVDMLDVIERELAWYWQFREGGMPKDIYIQGFSEGGSAALSCTRRIEKKRKAKYKIIKTFVGGGPYSLSASFDSFSKTNTTGLAPVIPSVALGMICGESLDVDLKNVFKEELYNNYKDWYFKKEKSIYEVHDLITHNGTLTKITDYMSNDFVKEGFGGNKDLQKIYDACKKNDNIDWTPRSPIMIIHSTGDDVVPFVNAQLAYDSFINRGADPSIIQLKTVDGLAHQHSILFFYREMLLELK